MRMISVKLALIVIVVLSASTVLMAAGDRIDLRLGQKRVDDRIATPRLALGTLKEKDEKEELQVAKKRASVKTTTRRVVKKDEQRKKKTKRVVASQ